MNIKEILKARGLDEEQSKTLIENPAYATLLESFVKEAEDGKTAYQKAQEIEQNLKTWNETQVVPYVRAADEKVAKTEAQLAATRAHMKALKDAGYDIPDSYLEGSATVAPKVESAPSGIDSKTFDERTMDIAKTNMALVSLSNRHRALTNSELDLESEYSDFEKNKRPQENLRAYIARKYDHDGLQAKRQQEAEQKKLDEYAAKKVQEEIAKYKQANGPNPETRNPKSSRFDEIARERSVAQGQPALWQTREGRERATKARLEKYTQGLVQ